MELPSVSVVIPAWNGRDLLDDCLRAVASVDYPELEIVVVDNGSTDGSAELVARRAPRVKLVRSRRNLGFSGGVNLGIRSSAGDILVLLNQDAVVERGWLRPLVRALLEPGVGVVGGLCLYPDGVTVQSAGGDLVWPLGLAFPRGQNQPDGPEWSRPSEPDFVSGCGMAFRRDLLAAIGPLDEAFWPGYFEDADFCVRARRAGRAVRFVPAARLRHLESASFRRWRSIWRFHHRSRLHFVLKHLRAPELEAEFLPAERQTLPALLATQEPADLSRAYLEAGRRSLPRLVRSGHLEPAEAERLASALSGLAELAATGAGGSASEGPPALLATRAHLLAVIRHLRTSRAAAGSDQDSTGEPDLRWLQMTLESRQTELESVKEVLAARTREIAEAERQIESLREESGVLRDVVAAREDQVRVALDEVDAHRGIVAQRDTQVESLDATLQARTNELAAAGEQIASLTRTLAARDEQIAALLEELERHRRELEASQREAVSVSRLLESRNDQVGALEEELKSQRLEVASGRNRIRQLATRIAHLESGLLGRLQSWRDRRLARSKPRNEDAKF